MIEFAAQNPILSAAFAAVIAALSAAFWKWISTILKSKALQDGLRDVLVLGIAHVKDTADKWKKANTDGQLTPEERATLRHDALLAAKDFAKGTIKEFIEHALQDPIGRAELEARITTIVEGM